MRSLRATRADECTSCDHNAYPLPGPFGGGSEPLAQQLVRALMLAYARRKWLADIL